MLVQAAIRRWRRHALQTMLGFCLSVPLVASGTSVWEAPPPRAHDVHYGTVLYLYYQQNHFGAITRLKAMRTLGRLQNHADEAEVVLGGLKLSYGLDDDAEAVFRRLLTRDVPEDIRNRAWLYLARIQYRKGQYAEAEATLAHVVEGESGRNHLGERQLLQGLIRMARADFAGAVAALRAWRGDADSRPYADYNLAVALIRSGDTGGGLRLLDQLGRGASGSDEYLALQDKANLAAAEVLLRTDRPQQARQRLDRVRLHGPYSNQALLWSGMTWEAVGDHERALVPWSTLLERPHTDPMVQEALLAVPHAYDRLSQPTRAAARLENAISVLERERRDLRRAMQAMKLGELHITGVLEGEADNGDDVRPLASLVELLAGHRFHQTFQNYRDIRALRDNLDYWADAVSSFDDMLEAQEAIYAQRLPETRKQLERLDFSTGQVRRDALKERFRQAELGDAWVLATSEEKRRWHRLQDVDQRLARLPAEHPELDSLRTRHRVLSGLVRWSVETDFAPRLWESRQQLRALDQALSDQEGLRRSLDAAERYAYGRFDGFAERIEHQRDRIARLQPRLAIALEKHQASLQRQALDVLREQDSALEQKLLRARYALAGIHDAAGRAPRRESQQ
ncbi:MAG: tetratricopeptide repeat protein [Ectothiorhodospiraceae bacterium]|nr:tetratricopeptide repeat protein [Ectothiorhodospiraceae bacterium]